MTCRPHPNRLSRNAGGAQSVKDGLDDAANGPRIYDTEAVVYPSSSSSSLSLDELERMSKERSGRSVEVIVMLNTFYVLEMSRLRRELDIDF